MPESRPQMRRAGRTLTAGRLTEESASLTKIEGGFLHWLLRYPLQRADDLVVGVACWASRATVYRYLHVLETRGLVESVLPKTPGDGKYLYHLSNLGLHVLATSLERSAYELALRWHADETGLLRLLPRLPTLLLLQETVNGLVTGAAEAMTTRGGGHSACVGPGSAMRRTASSIEKRRCAASQMERSPYAFAAAGQWRYD